ncbi:ABC transporter permease [Microbacterium marinilacus]|uniref:ABC transporter permease n=1 Tax=Microbacterium marinilacus TaxID=415209 RepID=A0ABP7BXV8_9MICO|nr:ABC transporter permease [Microbacterium marinilacus]MBY0688154.1 ABC transporter permease [Microbacterium marinilacus]
MTAADTQAVRAPRRADTSALGYLTRRLGQGVLVLWGAFTVSFIITYLLPGDAISILVAGGPGGDAGNVSEEDIAALRAEYNLDKPVLVQYALALWGAVRLDFGTSIMTGQDVVGMLAAALPQTLQLSLLALALSLVIGTVVALSAVYARSPWLATVLAGLPALGVAVPTFWIGLLLLQTFSFGLGWLPAMGNGGLETLILPALTLAVPNSALIAQVLLRSLEDIWRQPFVLALQGKGLTRLGLLLRHGLRNAVIPALSLAGVVAGNFLSGTVVVETVFTREGIGRLAQMGVQNQDLPLVQVIVVFAAAVFVLTSLAVDLLYPVIDPRMRRARSRAPRPAEEAA